MYEDWDWGAQPRRSLTRAADISAVLRAADDADAANDDFDDELDFNQPFDPHADESE